MTDSENVSRRLLIIDDDPSCRTTIAYLLQRLGHTVEAAESGSAGLALLRHKPVDLVLTDLVMPGLTGWDVARFAKGIRPRLPVVPVTGWAHAISADQPERQFVDAILAKPFGVAAMQAVIGTLTRDPSETVYPGGPESVWLTKGRGWPMSSPVSGHGLEAPVDVHGVPMEGNARTSKGFVA